MRGISEERLRNIEKYYAARGISPMLPIGDLIRECQELNPWMTLEEFLKSEFEGLCWVDFGGEISYSLYQHRNFVHFQDFRLWNEESISLVMPIHRPEPPR